MHTEKELLAASFWADNFFDTTFDKFDEEKEINLIHIVNAHLAGQQWQKDNAMVADIEKEIEELIKKHTYIDNEYGQTCLPSDPGDFITAAARLIHFNNNAWIRVEDGLPEVKLNDSGKECISSVLGIEGLLKRKMVWYYPQRFRKLEWDDWEDFDIRDYPYIEEDEINECYWLKAGWYEELYHPTDDYNYYKPVKITHWQPLPPPPVTDQKKGV